MKRQTNALVNDKHRSRASAKEKENKLSQTIKLFSANMQTLSSYSHSINNYIQTNKLEELHQISNMIESTKAEIEQYSTALDDSVNELEAMKSRVGEQERYKKSIQDNLSLLEKREKVNLLKEEYEILKADFREMADSNSTGDDYDTSVKKKNRLLSEKARREGRIGELKYQQKELKVSNFIDSILNIYCSMFNNIDS